MNALAPDKGLLNPHTSGNEWPPTLNSPGKQGLVDDPPNEDFSCEKPAMNGVKIAKLDSNWVL